MSDDITPGLEYSTTGDEAVVFTAGVAGVAFGAGVIHAYLATNRRPPRIVAGVSGGALSSAAMQRCFKELEVEKNNPNLAERETARWKWFRQYLSFLTTRPFAVLWQTLPDLSDVLSGRPPIREPALPAEPNTPAWDHWYRREQSSRLEFHLSVKLLRWLAALPISVRRITKLAVSWVRRNEQFPDNVLPRFLRGFTFWCRALMLVWILACHNTTHPNWLWRRPFRDVWKERLPFRPVFGYRIWLLSILVSFIAPILVLSLVVLFNYSWRASAFVFGSYAMLTLAAVAFVVEGETTPSSVLDTLKRLGRLAMTKTQLRDAILNDFYLRLQLFNIFKEDTPNGPIDPAVDDDPMPALLVAAPLESSTGHSAFQVWPMPISGVPPGVPRVSVVDALCAALAIPPLIRPTPIESAQQAAWHGSPKHLGNASGPDPIHLVDGATILQNPVPALFDALKRAVEKGSAANPFEKKLQAIAEALTARDPGDRKIHIVYSIPIERKVAAAQQDLAASGAIAEVPNCVDNAQLGLKLEKRRDSRLEVWQTNYQTEMQLALHGITRPQHRSDQGLPILIDEIAPDGDFDVKNALAPSESEVLRIVASGCRATISSLMANELASGSEPVPCPKFLRNHVHGRSFAAPTSEVAAPGVTEVCRHCTRTLTVPQRAKDLVVAKTHTAYVENGLLNCEFLENPELVVDKLRLNDPRIVFVASGGVFRGAFHVGMIAAMYTCKIKPDLIAGASVGTVMGTVLGILSVSEDRIARRTLGTVTDWFIEVDDQVALTKRLKSAARNLGVRGSTVTLTPARVTRKIKRGSRHDAGFAATGAPPALIDALSRLFAIPHKQTERIAAMVVSDNIVGAVRRFLVEFRTETIGRLGVRDAVLGTELLELRIAKVFQDADPLKLRTAQPFQNVPGHDPITLIATCVNLTEEWLTIFGIDVKRQSESYDYLQACLSSCAFPFAFSPRRESQVYPANGRRDVFYSDGGMFDNLPFLPAMLVLGAHQRHELSKDPGTFRRRVLEHLVQKRRSPDLFLVGALDADPFESTTPVDPDEFRSVLTIHNQVQQLSKNEKTRRFQRMMQRIDGLLESTLPEPQDELDACIARGSDEEWHTLARSVNAGVLSVAPTDREHLNGTFAFCRSVFFTPERVKLSIADGCFRTLRAIAAAQSEIEDSSALKPTVAAIKGFPPDRIPLLKVRAKRGRPRDRSGNCAWFEAVKCPFLMPGVKQPGVYEQCVRDRTHIASWKGIKPKQPVATELQPAHPA